MSRMVRRLSLFLVILFLLGGASAAYADSYQVTFSGISLSGPIFGSLNLGATPLGGGSFLVTSVSGAENGLTVGGIVAANSTGYFLFPNGNGFQYDNKLFPAGNPVFDNAGLLFTLLGPGGTSIYENLYSIGPSFYLESAYLNNGAPYPFDFSYDPVKITVVATPEPSKGLLVLFGVVALMAVTIAKKAAAR